MSDIQFWKPVGELFRPDKPLAANELLDFYVSRDNSPVDGFLDVLEMEGGPAHYLLAGHRGGGKTTELRRLEKACCTRYSVVWVDTDTNLDRFNIGYAEVVVLIGMTIVQTLQSSGWRMPTRLSNALADSLARVTYQEQDTSEGGLGLGKIFTDLGLLLKVGFQEETQRKREVRPALSEIIARVNDIIDSARKENIELLVIIDGLDRKEYRAALEMFSSSLLTSLRCHTVYVVPIALRYSAAFSQAKQEFSDCLDLDNVSVFRCDEQKRPTQNADEKGRQKLAQIVNKRIDALYGQYGKVYDNLFEADALELLCVMSGGLIRELVRLTKSACKVALRKKVSTITVEIAEEAVREERRDLSVEDYHYPELDKVNRTGQKTSSVFEHPKHGPVIICDELLHYKLILGYDDAERGPWFDVNPMLMDDLARWREGQQEA